MGWGEYCAANGLALSSGMSGSSSQMFCDLSQQEEAFLPRDSFGGHRRKEATRNPIIWHSEGLCCFWPWGNRGPSCSGLASVKSRETCIPQCQDGPLACAFSTRSNVPNVETGFGEAIGEAKGEANALKTILFFFHGGIQTAAF